MPVLVATDSHWHTVLPITKGQVEEKEEDTQTTTAEEARPHRFDEASSSSEQSPPVSAAIHGGRDSHATVVIPAKQQDNKNHNDPTAALCHVLVIGGNQQQQQQQQQDGAGGSFETTSVLMYTCYPCQTKKKNDTTNEEWTWQVRSGPSLQQAREDVAAVLCGPHVYAIGGYNGRTDLDTLECLSVDRLLCGSLEEQDDELSGSSSSCGWTTLPSCRLSSPRTACAAVTIRNRYIVVMGGTNGYHPLDTVDILDTQPFTNATTATSIPHLVVTAGPRLTIPRWYLGATVTTTTTCQTKKQVTVWVVGGKGPSRHLHYQSRATARTQNAGTATGPLPTAMNTVECWTLSLDDTEETENDMGTRAAVSSWFESTKNTNGWTLYHPQAQPAPQRSSSTVPNQPPSSLFESSSLSLSSSAWTNTPFLPPSSSSSSSSSAVATTPPTPLAGFVPQPLPNARTDLVQRQEEQEEEESNPDDEQEQPPQAWIGRFGHAVATVGNHDSSTIVVAGGRDGHGHVLSSLQVLQLQRVPEQPANPPVVTLVASSSSSSNPWNPPRHRGLETKQNSTTSPTSQLVHPDPYTIHTATTTTTTTTVPTSRRGRRLAPSWPSLSVARENASLVTLSLPTNTHYNHHTKHNTNRQGQGQRRQVLLTVGGRLVPPTASSEGDGPPQAQPSSVSSSTRQSQPAVWMETLPVVDLSWEGLSTELQELRRQGREQRQDQQQEQRPSSSPTTRSSLWEQKVETLWNTLLYYHLTTPRR